LPLCVILTSFHKVIGPEAGTIAIEKRKEQIPRDGKGMDEEVSFYHLDLEAI
jgi:hypothetical protein